EASWSASSMRDCAAASGKDSNSKNTHGVMVVGSILHAPMAPCVVAKCGKVCAPSGESDSNRWETSPFSTSGHLRSFFWWGRVRKSENGAESTLCMMTTGGEEVGLFSNRHVEVDVAHRDVAGINLRQRIARIRCDNMPRWLR